MQETKRVRKIINLCSSCSQCPVVEIREKEVRIGEKGNLCVLKKKEWEALKKKILEGEC